MPYVVKTVEAGEYRRVMIYAERVRGTGRSRRRAPSAEAQLKLNERNSENRLRELVHANFTPNDFAVRLDYNKLLRTRTEPISEREARGKLTYFIRRLRALYGSLGVAFKYMYNVEVGAKSGKIHHHLFISGSPESEIRGYLREQIEKIWWQLGHGYGNVRRLEFDENGVSGLVHYFIKDRRDGAKRWVSSRNIIRPSVENGMIRRVVGGISARDAKYIDANPYDTEFIRRRLPGWTTVSVRTTAVSSSEDATPHELPWAEDSRYNIRGGLVYPDYGGVFLELWQYRDGQTLFVPIGTKSSKKKY